MLLQKIMKEKSLEILMKKFEDMNITTQKVDWSCVIESPVYECQVWHSTKKFDFRFFNSNLGFIDVQTHFNDVEISLNILNIFRHVSKGNDFVLIKALFEFLLKEDNNPNKGYYEDNETNLTGAIINGNLEIVKYLVEKGVSIHTDYEMNVIMALKHNHCHIAEYFLNTDPKIDINYILNDNSLSPIMKNFVNKWQLQRNMSIEMEEKIFFKKPLKI